MATYRLMMASRYEKGGYMQDANAVGNRIKSARIEAGFASQEDAAKRIGVSTKSVSLWELGKSVPSLTSAAKIADAYGCTIDHLACR